MNKTCTKCHEEKSLDQFVRRGSSRQNICKSCHSADARERRSAPKQAKSPKQHNPEALSIIGVRIQSLEPRLRLIARQYSSDPHQAEDIFQHVCEKLLTQSDPNDSDSRILIRAKCRAGDFMNAERTYTYYVGSESELSKGDQEETDLDAFDFHISDPRSAEDMAVEAEEVQSIMSAINSLSPSNQQIVSMLISGMKQVEISKKLGVSEDRISRRVSSIAKQLEVFGIKA